MSEQNNTNQNGQKQLSVAEIESEFEKFLEEKGYDWSGAIEMEQDIDINDGSYTPVKQKPIRSISEKLNEREWGFEIYTDTRKILPGLVVYIIEQIAPNEKIPYATYKPAPRIITEIQDNGANNGAVFFTYSHKITAPMPAYSEKLKGVRQVVSESQVIYSPLTKDHAAYICKLLNLQSRQMYMKEICGAKKQIGKHR